MLKNLFFSILLAASLLPYEGISQMKHFHGAWTKINTTYVFEFDLHLEFKENNQVEGYFDWTILKCHEKSIMSKAYYKDKIGKSAKEYVRGTFNPTSRELLMKGYRKEDPHSIIGIDHYKLKLKENGQLEGQTKADGNWKGRIKGNLGVPLS